MYPIKPGRPANMASGSSNAISSLKWQKYWNPGSSTNCGVTKQLSMTNGLDLRIFCLFEVLDARASLGLRSYPSNIRCLVAVHLLLEKSQWYFSCGQNWISCCHTKQGASCHIWFLIFLFLYSDLISNNLLMLNYKKREWITCKSSNPSWLLVCTPEVLFS